MPLLIALRWGMGFDRGGMSVVSHCRMGSILCWMCRMLFGVLPQEGSTVVLQRTKTKVSKIAAVCGSSRYAIERIKTAFEEGGFQRALALKWGAGAVHKGKMKEEEIAWLIDPNTLRIHSHMSLAQRAGALNTMFDCEVSAKDVREIFRGMGITKQRFKSAMGPPKPTEMSLQKQQDYIDASRG